MWIAFSLISAVGVATTSLVLKRAVLYGGVAVSTAALRALAGLILLGVVVAQGGWPAATPAYWRVTALVILPEVGGMVLLTAALRAGELSLVQPIMGLIPLLTTVGGFVILGEAPTPLAAAGILAVAAGVYCVGLQRGARPLDPLRALARERASWYAVGAACFWSLTTVLHRVGIAEVGPFPWAVTLTLGSAAALALWLPVIRWRTGRVGLPTSPRPWLGLMAAGGVSFTVLQTGLHLALSTAHAGYVVAVQSTSILMSTALGVWVLGERSAARYRILGGALVSAGAVLIALFG